MGLAPLQIDVNQFGVAGQHIPNIEAACQRGYPEIAPAVVSHDGTMIVAGSGPSLPAFIEEIRKERERGRPICAVKGAHDFLCEHGIEPDLFVSVEPRDRRRDLRKKNSHTVYLLASRVAPEVFDHLDGCKILLWHSYGRQEEVDAMKGKIRMAIGGGSTSGLRAISVAYLAMGFRNFILYGFDSCNDKDGRKRFDGSKTGVTMPVIIPVGNEKRTFICNMAMAAQVNEFQRATYGWLPGIHIESRGPGAISALLESRAKAGLPV